MTQRNIKSVLHATERENRGLHGLRRPRETAASGVVLRVLSRELAKQCNRSNVKGGQKYSKDV